MARARSTWVSSDEINEHKQNEILLEALDKNVFAIGRSTRRDVCIKLKAVSADHCAVAYDDTKGWSISEKGKDKMSSNGTFVFMKTHSQMQEHAPSDLIPLHDGMVLSFINYEMRVNLERKDDSDFQKEAAQISQANQEIHAYESTLKADAVQAVAVDGVSELANDQQHNAEEAQIGQPAMEPVAETVVAQPTPQHYDEMIMIEKEKPVAEEVKVAEPVEVVEEHPAPVAEPAHEEPAQQEAEPAAAEHKEEEQAPVAEPEHVAEPEQPAAAVQEQAQDGQAQEVHVAEEKVEEVHVPEPAQAEPANQEEAPAAEASPAKEEAAEPEAAKEASPAKEEAPAAEPEAAKEASPAKEEAPAAEPEAAKEASPAKEAEPEAAASEPVQEAAPAEAVEEAKEEKAAEVVEEPAKQEEAPAA